MSPGSTIRPGARTVFCSAVEALQRFCHRACYPRQPRNNRIAGQGVEVAVANDPALASGANVWLGDVVHEGVAHSLSLPLADRLRG